MAAAWALIIHEGKLLLTQRSATTSRPGQWCLPGGGIKNEETAENACVRETLEETGLAIQVLRLIEQIEESHYFLCELASVPQEIKLQDAECQDAAWSVPSQILSVGMIMDLKRLVKLFEKAGLKPPLIDGGGA